MRLSEVLQSFAGVNALVLGDLMLDEYIFGRATRISPEAPVMVVRHHKTTRVPGGAANVARNLNALGANTRTIGVAGCDEAGDLLQKSLLDQGITGSLLVRDGSRATTRKTRVIADHTHQVLRIDHEDDGPISGEVESKVIETTLNLLDGVEVVVLSDYLKGVLTPEVVSAVMSEAKRLSKAVVVNPKPRTAGLYKGASLVSLNRAEATEALGLVRPLSDEDAADGAKKLREDLGAEAVLVTLGEAGMVAAGRAVIRVQAPKVEVYDTAGAGDTVIATVALGLVEIGFRPEVFELAARMAASVVRHVGVATPSASDIEDILRD